ncbi:MAG: SEL1-like repeat protein [Ahrensia sp.]|nr:SEL1-like repeat protein [Ahrensia sp.]
MRSGSKAKVKKEPKATDFAEAKSGAIGETFVSDEPIEPGSGGADLSAIMRRVREDRAGASLEKAISQNQGGLEHGALENDKSDFIAAARRAAKAAAADATVISRPNASGKSKGSNASLGSMLAQRRKPILMGAGAILLALLSLPLISGYLSSDDSGNDQTQEVASSLENTPTTDSTGEEAVRVIEDNTITTNTASGFGFERPISQDDAASTDSASSNENVDIAPVAAFTINDIPEKAGTIALREAAVNGDPIALYIVGDYYTGGVPSQSENDLGKALQWYERSAELGYAPAQYRTGNFYEKGLGTSRDIATAKTWYQLAAEQGNAAAMHNLAVLFASGADGTPDFNSATRWFLDAAELGVKDSQFNLGILSAKGEGIAQDLAESYKWFALAAKAGDKDAEAKRDEVANALRPDQLEKARGATDLWKPKELIEEVNMVTVPEAWQMDKSQTAATQPAISPADMKKAVRNIQGILNNNGYNAGVADGVMGEKTRNAIIAFKKANGMEPNADVNQALVQKLLEVNKAKSS